MKCLLTISIIFLANTAFTQSASADRKLDTSQFKFAQISDSTGFGESVGQVISKEIGTSGGIIISEDKRVELIFPQGALLRNTMISIQASANLAPNGVGSAYRFEPSGIQFQKPVKIIMHYTDDEADVCPPEWMSLAIQNDKGRWTFVEYDEVDSLSKTLVGYIHHFSSATNVNQIALRPDRMKIPVSDSVMIEVVDISLIDTGHYTTSGFGVALVNKTDPVLWYANRVQNGDNINGRIRAFAGPLGKEKVMLAQYFAPDILPKKNAVAIWAEVYRKSKKGKELRRRIKTYIEVYDRYHVSVVQQSTLRVGMGSEIIDSASFDVYVYAHSFQVVRIKNYSPVVLKEGSRKPFKEKIIVGDALGTVHITEGIKNDSLSHDYPPEVYFEFTPVSVLVCKFQHGARGIWSDPEPLFEKYIPQEINFIANGQDQKYSVTNGEGFNYKLLVHRLKIRE